MRVVSSSAALLKACLCGFSAPSTAAGSGMLQWMRSGSPGKTVVRALVGTLISMYSTMVIAAYCLQYSAEGSEPSMTYPPSKVRD